MDKVVQIGEMEMKMERREKTETRVGKEVAVLSACQPAYLLL